MSVRWALVGSLLAAGAVAISGCGVSSTIDPVAQAATQSTKAPGYRMTMSMSVSTPALPTPLTGTGSGSFETGDHLGSLSMSMSLGALGSNPQVRQLLGGSTLRIDEVIDRLTVYMKLPAALTSKLSGGKPWLKLDVAKAGSALGMPGLSTLESNPAGGDPSQMLRYLRASSGQLKNLGKAEINGIETTHYSATIDLNKVPDEFPPSERAAVRQTVNTLKGKAGLSSIPVNVWIDQQHLVRRMQLSLSETQANVTLGIDFTDYGPQPAPAVPPASQVTNITSLAGIGASGL